MEIFTANQVNQVYVLKSDSTVVANLDADHQITKANNLGSVGVGQTPDGKSIYFKHLGAGGLNRSALIRIANIMDVKATPASAMARDLKVAKVTLNSAALSSTAPIAGQDYMLRIKFDKVISLSPENQYWKYGIVHAVSGMSASDFYKTMALSLAMNMSRDAVKLVSIILTTASDPVEVTPTTSAASLTGTYTGILVKEVEQEWILGIKQQKPVSFVVEPTTIEVGTPKEEVYWGDVVYNNGEKITGGVIPTKSIVTEGAPTTTQVKNGKRMADYEYFYAGEKGDQYRMVNWPDYIPVKYLVDPALEYDTVAIHFAYTGANHAVQKSEQDITFIVPRAVTDTTASQIGAKAASLLNAIKAIVGTDENQSAAIAALQTAVAGKLDTPKAADITDEHLAVWDKDAQGNVTIKDGGAVPQG